jgi:hypothetical protein
MPKKRFSAERQRYGATSHVDGARRLRLAALAREHRDQAGRKASSIAQVTLRRGRGEAATGLERKRDWPAGPVSLFVLSGLTIVPGEALPHSTCYPGPLRLREMVPSRNNPAAAPQGRGTAAVGLKGV